MKVLSFALRSFGRELRSGELLVLLSAITLAVAALTAVGFLTDRIGRAVERQANEVLAADVRLRAPDPIPDEWRERATALGLEVADMLTFPSVVFLGDSNALSTIRAVSAGYPLRGQLRIADRPFGEQLAVTHIPDRGEVWADRALLSRLDANVGDRIEVGNSVFLISAVLTYRPDQSAGFSSLAPTLIVNIDDLPDTGLISVGSRVSYALLVAGEERAVTEYEAALEDELPESIQVSNQADRGEQVMSAVDRSKRFLSLTAVISVLLSAVAIAMSARRFAQRRMDTVALMKSIGATQGFVVSVASLQLLLLGAIGVILGCITGYLAEETLAGFLSGIIADDLPAVSLAPVWLASSSAFLLLVGFALPSLLELRNTPPLRVLRHDIVPVAPSRLLVAFLAIAAVGGLLYLAIGDARLLLIVLGGMLLISTALFLAGRLLVALMGRFRGGVGVAWRYGLANVARRGRDSTVQVVAFGLGLTVLLLLSIVRTDLLQSWRQSIAEDAPNHFFINIQTHERDAVGAAFAAAGLEVPEFVPLVRARMTEINGESVKTREYPDPEGSGMANREANLTWRTQLGETNTLTEGEWWPADYRGEPLVSVEADAAREMGLALGDRLRFLIAGQEIELRVTSFREVNWDSFQPNFFMVISPGALDGFPSTYVTSLRIPDDRKSMLPELVRAHPSVSVIDIDAVLAQIRNILDKASLAVQTVFLFTLAAGIAVLFAAVQSTIDERRYESAMLRALGVRRRVVLYGILTEFAALGVAAGLLAAVGASVLAWQLTSRVFELEYQFSPALWLSGLGGGLAVVCISGFLAARGAINAPPVDVLRESQ